VPNGEIWRIESIKTRKPYNTKHRQQTNIKLTDSVPSQRDAPRTWLKGFGRAYAGRLLMSVGALPIYQ